MIPRRIVNQQPSTNFEEYAYRGSRIALIGPHGSKWAFKSASSAAYGMPSMYTVNSVRLRKSSEESLAKVVNHKHDLSSL